MPSPGCEARLALREQIERTKRLRQRNPGPESSTEIDSCDGPARKRRDVAEMHTEPPLFVISPRCGAGYDGICTNRVGSTSTTQSSVGSSTLNSMCSPAMAARLASAYVDHSERRRFC
jgi:hypothetical protein